MKRSRAVTLIEMLLALSMFSILAVSLYGVFSGGLQIEKRFEGDNRLYQELRWSFDTMARDIEQMVLYDFGNSYPEKKAFAGTAESLSLIVPTDEGLEVISYALEQPESGSIYATIVGQRRTKNTAIVTSYEEKFDVPYLLVRRRQPFAESLQPSSAVDAERTVVNMRVVASGLRVSYAYLRGEGADAEVVWKDTWPFDYLPSGIRVALTLRGMGRSPETVTIHKDIFIPTGFLGQEEL